MKRYRFETLNAAGRNCCKSDDLELLCDACRPRAAAAAQTGRRDVYAHPPDPWARRVARTDADLRQILDLALRAVEPAGYLGIRAVQDGELVVYDVQQPEGGAVETYARPFEVDDDGRAQLGERMRVREETSFHAAERARAEFYGAFGPGLFGVAPARSAVYTTPPDAWARR